MAIYTVSWKFESRAWTCLEADSPEAALQMVKDGQYDDVDSDETTRKPWGYEVADGITGACVTPAKKR